LNELLALQKDIAGRKTSQWLGRRIEVLVETQDELGRWYGRSRQGKRVVVKRAHCVPGELVEVDVEESTPAQLAGPLAA
jgi:tRNA A37 methylthiotransferase MiaB